MKAKIILLTLLVIGISERVSGQKEWARVPSPLDTINGNCNYNLRINKHGDIYIFIKSTAASIFLLKNSTWQKLNVPDTNELVPDIVFDSSGAAWFMDLKTNLFRHDGTTITAFINSNPINNYTSFGKLSISPDNSIWGVFYVLDSLTMDNNSYLVKYSNGTWTEFNMLNANIPLKFINHIQADSNRLWMSAYYSHQSDTLFYYLQSGLVYPVTRQDVGAPPQSQINDFNFSNLILDDNGWLNVICLGFSKAFDFIYDGSAWHEREVYLTNYLTINNLHLDSLNRMIFDFRGGGYRGLFYNNLPVSLDGYYPPSNNGFPLSTYLAWDMDPQDRIWVIEDVITPILYRFDPNGFNRVSGQVFYDLNNDGLLNNNEPGILNQHVTLSPGPIHQYTNTEGYKINLFDTSGSYSIAVATPPYWQITTIPPVQNFSQATLYELTDSVNFGFYPTQIIQDLQVFGSLNGTRPGYPGLHWLNWKNNGTTIAGPDTLTITLDPKLQFSGSNPAPVMINGQVIKWLYSSLTPFSSGQIQFQYNVDSMAILGDSVFNIIEISPAGTDATPGNNIVEMKEIIRGSYDPNEKTVTPAGIGMQGYISPFEEITYKIYFQNTGNDTALQVSIFDILNENLDISSLKINGSSHAFNWYLDFSRQLIFRFPSINLPDSNTNELMSHGYVSFSIRPKPGLSDQTIITNTAGIVFDFNPPIMTNQVVNTIQLALGEEEVDPVSNQIFVSPNPVKEQIWIHWNAEDKFFRLELLDITGCVLAQENAFRNNQAMYTGSLAPGVYILRGFSDRQVCVTRFIKQ